MNSDDKEEVNITLPVENVRRTKAKFLDHGIFRAVKLLMRAFQSSTQERECPPGKSIESHVRLITINFSHYCEKVRFAFDLLENDSDKENKFYYTEDAHPPAFSFFETIPASNDQASSAPMVVYKDPSKNENIFLHDSSKIMENFCSFLYEAGTEAKKQEIKDLENYFDENLGPTLRVALYFTLLQPKYFSDTIEMGSRNTSVVEAFLFSKMLGKGLSDAMKKSMKIDSKNAEISWKAVRSVFQKVSERLIANGWEKEPCYLIPGCSFTAADLTFASLASPLISPPELRSVYPSPDEFPYEIKQVRDELIDSPAGQFVLHLYKMHRFGVKCNPKENQEEIIVIKDCSRNALFGFQLQSKSNL